MSPHHEDDPDPPHDDRDLVDPFELWGWGFLLAVAAIALLAAAGEALAAIAKPFLPNRDRK